MAFKNDVADDVAIKNDMADDVAIKNDVVDDMAPVWPCQAPSGTPSAHPVWPSVGHLVRPRWALRLAPSGTPFGYPV
jgi:hypothetical protein